MSSELTPTARQLLHQAKATQMRAPAGMKERVQSAVLDAVATTRTGSASGLPPRTQRRWAHRLMKPWIAATLVTLASVGWWGAVSVQHDSAAAPSGGRTQTPAAMNATAETPPASSPPPAAAPSSQSAPTSDLRAEMAWLARAEATLRKRDPEAALRELRAGRDRFAHGQLQAEREGLELVAQCRLGRDVSSELSRYLAQTPDGVLVARARRACLSRPNPR